MESGQRCWHSRSISRIQRNWCAGPGVITGSCSAPKKGHYTWGPLSSLMFNVCVDVVVREWLHQMLGEEATRHGLGEHVVKILVAFYVDDRLIASHDPVWLQESFNVLIRLFERIGLFMNATKMKAMVCIPGQIQEGYTEEEYAGYKSPTETSANRKRCLVDCEICGTSLAAGSYQSHLESQHNVFCSMVLQQDIVVDCTPVVYCAIKSLSMGTYFCLVPHCIGEASTKWALRQHFLFCHPQDLVVLPSEGTVPFLRCKRCGMQNKVGTLYRKHQRTHFALRCGRGRSNMKPLRLQGLPLLGRLWPTGKIWRWWRCSNI